MRSPVRFFLERPSPLKQRDLEREADPQWYKSSGLTGMMLYIDNFAENLNGVREKLPYIQQTGVNMLHLMPFLDTIPERSDGGYAVADFRRVRPDLGTMEDLKKLTAACHKQGINVCMDYVMNHTSQDHEWAKRARQGDGEYMSRYFFFDNDSIPAEYEKTVPQVFPTTAPGNFTWLEDCRHFVMTTFYPYQWDLNYRSPRVFNERTDVQQSEGAQHPAQDQSRLWGRRRRLDTGDNGLLAIGRYAAEQNIIEVFNFTGQEKKVSFSWESGKFTDMLNGSTYTLQNLTVPAYGFYYLEQAL